MALRAQTVATTFLILLGAGTSVGWADPIVPRSGLLTVSSGTLLFAHANDDPDAHGQLLGSGFSLGLRSFFVGGADRPDASIDPFVAFPSFHTVGTTEPAVLRINNVELSFGANGQTEFNITAPLIRTRTTDPESESFDITYPFQFTGVLSGQVGADSFRFDIVGRGTGHTFFAGCCLGTFTDLTFTPAAPTPEPASVILVASGGVWALIRAKRKRQGLRLER